MAHKIEMFLISWAEENNCRIMDWQQVSPRKIDAWVINAKDEKIWGAFAPREYKKIILPQF